MLHGLLRCYPSRWRRLGSASLLGTFCTLGACQTDTLKSWFLGGHDGAPLTEFTARDGQYFPPFVEKFFAETGRFYTDYPTVAAARSDLKLIEVKPLSSQTSNFNEANLSWSADGAYLGFEVIVDGFRKIMLKDLVGDYARELRVIPKGRSDFLDGMVVSSAHSYNAGLRWSHDSTRFAFMSNGGVGEYNIYVGAIGADEKPVATSRAKNGYASWSPASNEVAFVSGRSGRGDIYLINLDNKKLSQLSHSDRVDIFPEWFPSSDRIVYASGDALNHDIYIIQRESSRDAWGEPWPLTQWSQDDLRPTVSPDGRYVAFYASSGEQDAGDGRKWNIFVVPFVQGKTYREDELRHMVVAKDVVIDLNTGPAWSPDSRKLFYVKRDPALFNPIHGYDLFSGQRYTFQTKTRMNRDILMSKLGVLSFRSQVGVWDKVFVALTNQGLQIQSGRLLPSKIHYLTM